MGEGPGYARTLANMDRGCAPAPNCLITADLGPVVYSIHHPYVAAATDANSSTWWGEFGYLVDHPAASGQAPVVDGEWTNEDAGGATPASRTPLTAGRARQPR